LPARNRDGRRGWGISGICFRRQADILGAIRLRHHHLLNRQWPGMPKIMILDTPQLLAENVFPKVRRDMQRPIERT
jgi:hypothetical protein